MSETCQKLAFTHPIVVLKSGLKNNGMKKIGSCEPTLWGIFNNYKAWFLLHGKHHDHVTKTKQL